MRRPMSSAQDLVQEILAAVRKYASAPDRVAARRLTVDLETEEVTLALVSLPPAIPAAEAGPTPFSQEERDILAVLDRVTWRTRKQISTATGLAAEGDLRVLLRNLVARGALESHTGSGYRLAAGLASATGDSAL